MDIKFPERVIIGSKLEEMNDDSILNFELTQSYLTSLNLTVQETILLLYFILMQKMICFS